MTREAYEQQIIEIENDVADMSKLCIESICNSVKSFLAMDKELAKKIRKSDDIIDIKEMEIEEKCVVLIATQAPVSSDLRRILSALKIISKLEKIGDNSSKIAKIVLKSKSNRCEDVEVLEVMKLYLKDMLTDAIIAYTEKDEELAREVYRRNKKIGKLFKELYRTMISYIIEDPTNTTCATEVIFVGKYLEQTGDIIESICDRVVYMITGERIKEEKMDYKHFE